LYIETTSFYIALAGVPGIARDYQLRNLLDGYIF